MPLSLTHFSVDGTSLRACGGSRPICAPTLRSLNYVGLTLKIRKLKVTKRQIGRHINTNLAIMDLQAKNSANEQKQRIVSFERDVCIIEDVIDERIFEQK